MASFQTQIVSLVCDTSSKDNVLDMATAAEPEAWWARDLTIRASVFSDAGVTLLDVSDLQSATLSLKDPSNLDGGALVTTLITAFDNATTLPTWQSGVQQQLLFAIAADQLSFAGLTNGARLLHLVITAITTGGQTGTLCVGTLNIVDDGGNSSADNPVNAITVTQAQAMVATLAWTAAAINLSAAGTTAIANAQTWLVGRQPVSVGAGSGAYIAALTLNDANALPGALIRIPVCFAATKNATIDIYDGTTGGALLQQITNPLGIAQTFYFQAGYDGAHWHKEAGFFEA